MKNLFKFITFIFIFAFIIGCCGTKNVVNNEVLGTSMKYSLYIEKATDYQVDSLISVDKLPQLERWLGNTFVDYNTNEMISKRMYIKKNDKGEVVYVITGNTEPFKIEKRITEK